MTRFGPVVFTVLPAFLFALPAMTTLAHGQSPYGYGGYGHGGFMHGDGWHGIFLGPLMMLIFLAIATAIVVLIARWIWGAGREPHYGAPRPKTPLDILEERFARGEIDASEFEERRRVLEK